MLSFLIDGNLGLNPDQPPWTEALPALGIEARSTTDLAELDRRVADHEPDVVFMPIADFHAVLASGDRHYRGLVMVTSKVSGTTNLPCVLVVAKDDPATRLEDLDGSTFALINRSCSSSYFAPAILVQRLGHRVDEYFDLCETAPWQGQIDAVISGQVRATMVPEDVWTSAPSNAEATKVIARYTDATGAVVVARADLDQCATGPLLDALLGWSPAPNAVFGGFKPFADSDVVGFFHDLDKLATPDS